MALLVAVAAASCSTSTSAVPAAAASAVGPQFSEGGGSAHFVGLREASELLDDEAAEMLQSFAAPDSVGAVGQVSNVVAGVGDYIQLNATNRTLNFTVHCLYDRQLTACSSTTVWFEGALQPNSAAVFGIELPPDGEQVILFHVREEYKRTATGAASGAIHGTMSAPAPAATWPPAPGVQLACGYPLLENLDSQFLLTIGACPTPAKVGVFIYDDSGIPSPLEDVDLAAEIAASRRIQPPELNDGIAQVVTIATEPGAPVDRGTVQWSYWRRAPAD